MKKFIGVLLTVILCVCMTMPVAFASAEDALTGGIADLVGGILSGDTSTDSLGLGSFDLSGIVGSFIEEEEAKEQVDPQVQIEQALQNAQDTVASKVPGAEAVIDFSWLTNTLSDSADKAVAESAVAEISADEMPGLLTVIADAFSGAGIDMTTFDVSALGKFDIVTLLGGADSDTGIKGTATDVAPSDSSMITTDIVTGIFDTLKGGLSTVGIDADALLGSLGDNELINFFANMYIGFCGPVATDEEVSSEDTTSSPDTGDTASAIVAVATLCVATAAAGVCLKKKED